MTDADPATSIAVVGMACRFPGARDVGEFWRNLRDGVESIRFFSEDELETTGIDPAVLTDPYYVRAGAILDDADLFDASFFGYSPGEARLLDPQQRVFLEVAWAALEDAGYEFEGAGAAVGVFAGAGLNTYLLNNLFAGRPFVNAMNDLQVAMAADKDFLASRLSYHLDFTGPSVVVQTACSTSLVAVAQACQSLLTHQCDVAVAGGVTIRFPPRRGYLHRPGSIFSPDGHCRAFDARAAGTVFGNGAGVVVLKRLSDAVADGDAVRAAILSTAVDNDGSAKVGYTAPSVDGQARAIRLSHALAGVSADTISYVEAHGTGTPVGDPIEIAGLTRAFRRSTRRNQFCALGSVKTNVGHLDAAAGVAGLIKTVLALGHRTLPPSLHYTAPNPSIDFATSPFFVNAELRPWDADGSPRRAGVSSFGVGGTNAHAVLEEAPPRHPPSPARPVKLMVFSGATPTALEQLTDKVADHLDREPQLNLDAAARTLQSSRKVLYHRRALACHDVADAVEGLCRPPERLLQGVGNPGGRAISFMFPGQGSQHVGMGRELHASEPVFREVVDRCCVVLAPLVGADLREVMWSARAADDRLDHTVFSQSALFVVEYALARLWMTWGVEPTTMIGHSLGELVAACLAGVFSLEDALRLVAERGRLMQQMPAGSMLIVSLPADDVRPRLGRELSLAAVNGPSTSVVSGPGAAIARLRLKLAAERVACRRLRTSHAFHSAMMEPLLPGFARLVADLERHPPRIPFVSNVTGTWITPSEATDPDYWASHVRNTVQFDAGVRVLLAERSPVLLEVGPGAGLVALARAHASSYPGAVLVQSMPAAHRAHSEVDTLVRAVGALWCAGAGIDWKRFHRGARRHVEPLPTYPFDGQRHWVDPAATETSAPTAAGSRVDRQQWFHVPVWKQSLGPSETFDRRLPGRGPWIVFVDDSSLSCELVLRLRARGEHVLTVRSAALTRTESDGWDIDAREPEAYRRLVADVAAKHGYPTRIVHLWGLAPAAPPIDRPPFADTTQLHGLFSLLFLARALEKEGVRREVEVIVVTTGVHDVTGEEPLSPPKATVLGACLVLPEEHPGIRCRLVDVVAPPPGSADERALVDRLVTELESGRVDPAVAFRGPRRWVQTFEQVSLPEAATPSFLRHRGVYLLTGGLGGVALTLARYLATTVAARIVLLARTALPEREAWATWLSTHDASDPTSRRIAGVRALEEQGAEVLVVRADVADAGELREALRRALERYGTINGVVHAAGTWRPASSLSAHLPVEEVARVLRPKVDGTGALCEALAGLELDWLVLCSSLASVLGGPGQADYCGANACLDAYAHQLSRSGLRTVAVGWDAWRDVGMAITVPGAAPIRELLAAALTPEEGVDAFARILGSGLPRVLVSTRDLSQRVAARAVAQRAVPTPATPAPPRQLATLSDLEAEIAGVWRDLLGVDHVTESDDFFELGGHSLLATSLLNVVRQRYNAELSFRSFFEQPTVRGLAASIRAAAGDSRPTVERLTRQQLLALDHDERMRLLRRYLRSHVGRSLGIDPEELAADGDLEPYEAAKYEADVLWSVKRDLGIPLYALELESRRTIDALAEFVAGELNPPVDHCESVPEPARLPARTAPVPDVPARNPGAVFVLSSPRSGSTLLRLMLAGSSRLFCPAELWLLGSEGMRDWAESRFGDLARQGLTQAFAQLRQLPLLEADGIVRQLVESDVAVEAVYRLLQEDAAPRMLVDKTPGYALDMQILSRAEALFQAPRYIHLVRHPTAVVESFVRNRFHRLAGEDGDPHAVAEKFWSAANRNAAELGREVGPRRYHRVRFEDLVIEPRRVLTELCEFLEVPFEPPILEPYGTGRLGAGAGDPSIYEHTTIDRSRADSWRAACVSAPLEAESVRLAEELGYHDLESGDATRS